jgi:hypothetical protein
LHGPQTVDHIAGWLKKANAEMNSDYFTMKVGELGWTFVGWLGALVWALKAE